MAGSESEKAQRGREEVFDPSRAELNALLGSGNPEGANLHFEVLDDADPGKFAALLDLARRGLRCVEDHKDFFDSPHGSLCGDGMFWYDLFLTISSMACGASKVGLDVEEVRSDLEILVDILVDFARYSTVNGGDITKRNYEALGNVLWAFKDERLIERAQNRAGKVRVKRVMEFVECTVERVRQLKPGKSRSQTAQVEGTRSISLPV